MAEVVRGDVGHVPYQEGQGLHALEKGETVVHHKRSNVYDGRAVEGEKALCSDYRLLSLGRRLGGRLNLLSGAVAQHDPTA